MKPENYFEETEPVYKVLNDAMKGISELKQGFYKSIFTPQYEALEDDEKNFVVGVLMGEYSLDIKDLIDECVKEFKKK
jgi:hypothetical protein